MNSRLDELQAAILRTKLTYLDADNLARRSIADRYTAGLAKSNAILPTVREGAFHVYHQYVIQVDRRDELKDRLKAEQIGTLIHYPVPVHQQPAFAPFNEELVGRSRLRSLPHVVTEQVASRILSLPMYPELPLDVVDRVAARVAALLEEIEA
jgi:dTDP-4-amino-4,6-dideoxygalactose transaminase